MNIILLSGGCGTRLWPVSNSVTPKQFLQVLNFDGQKESMLQRTYRLIRNEEPDANIVFAANKDHKILIENQITEAEENFCPGNQITEADEDFSSAATSTNICTEPCCKDTFPAISLASLYMLDVLNVDADDSVVVCPADAYAQESFYSTLNKLAHHSTTADCSLTVCGIKPTYPSESYGYVVPESNCNFSRVLSFVEKPNAEFAKDLIKQNALWNCGVFSFKLSYIGKKVKEITGYSTYEDIKEHYSELKKISFDYAVCEKESSIDVCKYSGVWKDIGTWNTLAEVLDGDNYGNHAFGVKTHIKDCSKSTVVNTSNVPVIVNGVDGIVVAVSDKGVLVTCKDKCEDVKQMLDESQLNKQCATPNKD